MKKILVVIVFILLISLFSGCIDDRKDEVGPFSKEFIKDYIKNPETIQFINETIYMGGPNNWNVYGNGTVEYEGNRRAFSYWIFVVDENNQLKCILKQLIIGEV